MKILIAEEDAVSRQVLRKILQDMDFEVVDVTDGEGAWDLLSFHDARIVITDWLMPGLDGPGLCRRIRARGDRGPYVYIILLTARHSPEDRHRAIQAGADDILVKPLDAAELSARLDVARRIIGMEEQLRARSAELERTHAELERRNSLLVEMASSDGLTGLKNHRFFCESLEAHYTLARCNGRPLSVVMIDVDQFKPYNDTFGHPAGDEILRTVARMLSVNVRDHDVVARYGGEEYGLILPGTDAEDALGIGERIRAAIDEHPWPLRPITISVGIATICPRVPRAAAMIEQADRSLYRSKALGRNRVTHARDLAARPDEDPIGFAALPAPGDSEFAPFLA